MVPPPLYTKLYLPQRNRMRILDTCDPPTGVLENNGSFFFHALQRRICLASSLLESSCQERKQLFPPLKACLNKHTHTQSTQIYAPWHICGRDSRGEQFSSCALLSVPIFFVFLFSQVFFQIRFILGVETSKQNKTKKKAHKI